MGTLTEKYRRRLGLLAAAEAAALLWGLLRPAYIGPACLLAVCVFAGVILAERERAAFTELFRSRCPSLYRESERPRGLLGFPRPMRACPAPEDGELAALWAERESGRKVSALALLGALAADVVLLARLALGCGGP